MILLQDTWAYWSYCLASLFTLGALGGYPYAACRSSRRKLTFLSQEAFVVMVSSRLYARVDLYTSWFPFVSLFVLYEVCFMRAD